MSSITTCVRREQRDAQLRDSVDDALEAVPVQPVGVLATTDESPPAGDAVAAIDRFDRAGGVDRSGDHDVGSGAEDAVERRSRQPGEIGPRCATDHHGPANRGVCPGERLEDAHRARQVGTDTAVAGGAGQPERAGRLELVEQVGGQPPRLLDFTGAAGDRWRQLFDGGQHVGGSRHGFVHHGHDCSSSRRSIGASAACRARSASSHPPLQYPTASVMRPSRTSHIQTRRATNVCSPRCVSSCSMTKPVDVGNTRQDACRRRPFSDRAQLPPEGFRSLQLEPPERRSQVEEGIIGEQVLAGVERLEAPVEAGTQALDCGVLDGVAQHGANVRKAVVAAHRLDAPFVPLTAWCVCTMTYSSSCS